jgi:hypothetical protein
MVATESGKYEVPVLLISKVLKTAEDFQAMNQIAKSYNTNNKIFDGYFVLGGNVAYNGNYVPMMDFGLGVQVMYSQLGSITKDADGYAMYNGKYLWNMTTWKLIQNADESLFTANDKSELLYNGGKVRMSNGSARAVSMGWGGDGFRGTFDGRGYTIDGMTVGDGDIGYTGFIPALASTGVIKNVGFTNAKLNNKGTGGGFLTMLCVEGSLIENVYVQLTDVTGSNAVSAIMVTDNTRSAYGAIIRDVFVDATMIEKETNAHILGGGYGDNSTVYCKHEGSYALVKTEKQATNAWGKGYQEGSVTAAYIGAAGLVADTAAQAELATWNTAYWTITDGVPTWNTAA